MKLKHDINGNKCLVIEGKDIGRKIGLVIQTNGNLHRTHRVAPTLFNKEAQDITFDEAAEWVRQHGTKSQRAKMGV